jgi:hypothetical protein
MSRAADYTIKGFLYQFNKSALEILKADSSATVNIEGVIEDVEVVTPAMTTGIQCKYHETSTGLTPSTIIKPLLQMCSGRSKMPIKVLHSDGNSASLHCLR